MAPAGGVDKQVYSQFTLGALQDSGWYLPRWGRGVEGGRWWGRRDRRGCCCVHTDAVSIVDLCLSYSVSLA